MKVTLEMALARRPNQQMRDVDGAQYIHKIHRKVSRARGGPVKRGFSTRMPPFAPRESESCGRSSWRSTYRRAQTPLIIGVAETNRRREAWS